MLSFIVGGLVHCRLPSPFNRWTVKWFARRYRLNMEEAEHPLSSYASIGELFTRKLKPGLRPVGRGLVHPADGQLTVRGWIYEGLLIQAKGIKYALKDFLDCPPTELKEFEGGVFLTYYLCPTDYHRVHSPVDGEIEGCVHIPGRLWPVNAWSVARIPRLFAVNERVVIWLRSQGQRIAVVMVGATNVGKITLSFDPKVVSNQGHWRSVLRKTYRNPPPIKKGGELGVFNMGSTVIVVLPKGFIKELPPSGPYPVRFGQSVL